MKDMTIKFSDTSYDFSGWMKEKCGNILLSLCGTLRDCPEVMNTESFQIALDNALKTYALCCGNLNGIRCDLVYSLLTTYNSEGYFFLEDLISGIEYGLYAKKMGGGSVDPATTDYNFAVSEGYLIENGKITEPVRGATLIGRGDETLMNIEAVSSNLELADGICGSVSGSVPTTVGQPAIKVRELTVGGR